MPDKDRKMKSIVFLVIGMIFILSLVVCVYITYSEKDLRETTAEVTNFNVALSGDKKNVTIIYTVDGLSYSSSFYTEDSLAIGEKIKLYYHEKDATIAKLYKTSLIIFICPIVGLILCIVGLIKVLKKNKYKDGIVEKNEFKEDITEPNKIVSLEEPEFDKENDTVFKENIDEKEDNNKWDRLYKDDNIDSPSDLSFKSATELTNISKDEILDTKDKEENEEEMLPELKNVKKEDNNQKINLVNVLPNNYYISGETLVYEEYSNHKEEIKLRDIDKLVITINSADKVVKLVVYTKKIKCILTKMKNIDLDKMVNTLKSKMNVIQKEFEETIEHKEY